MRTPKYDIGQRVERLTNSDTSAPMGSIATIQLVSIAEDYIMYYFKEGGFSLENDLADAKPEEASQEPQDEDEDQESPGTYL